MIISSMEKWNASYSLITIGADEITNENGEEILDGNDKLMTKNYNGWHIIIFPTKIEMRKQNKRFHEKTKDSIRIALVKLINRIDIIDNRTKLSQAELQGLAGSPLPQSISADFAERTYKSSNYEKG
jgi:hypothetical protein